MAPSPESYPDLAFPGASVFASSDLRLSVAASTPITAPLMNGKAAKVMPKTMGIMKPIGSPHRARESLVLLEDSAWSCADRFPLTQP
jgi:hypothetical protein